MVYALGTPYRWLVGGVTNMLSPFLHGMTDKFIEDSVRNNHAEDNPRLKELLKFEIERRAYGPGQTQDVAEPAIWQTFKIGVALTLPAIAKAIEDKIDNGKKFHLKWLAGGAALGIILRESVEFFRLTNRFVAGLQGSEKMALARENSIQETGVDPFASAVETSAHREPEKPSLPEQQTRTWASTVASEPTAAQQPRM